MMRFKVAASVAVAGLWLTSLPIAHAQVNISSGSAFYTFDPASPQTASFGDANTGNVLFEDHWLFRYVDDSGLGSETVVLSLDGSTSGRVVFLGTVNNADQAVSAWQLFGGVLQPVLLYQVVITHTISESSCGAAQLSFDVDITNFGGTAGSDYALFNFFDYDIDPFATNSAWTHVVGSDICVDMTGDAGNSYRVGYDADRHELREVGVGPRITSSILASTSYNLDNDPTSLINVDINAALQWDGTMPAAAASVQHSGFTANTPKPFLPSAFSLEIGSVNSGGLPEVLVSDDGYLVLDPQFTVSRYQLDVVFDGMSPTLTPTGMAFHLESRVQNFVGTIDQRMQLFNFQTMQYELIDNRHSAATDTCVLAAAAGDLSRFVDPGTGAVRARIRYQNSFPFWVARTANLYLPFRVRIDHAFWSITP